MCIVIWLLSKGKEGAAVEPWTFLAEFAVARQSVFLPLPSDQLSLQCTKHRPAPHHRKCKIHQAIISDCALCPPPCSTPQLISRLRTPFVPPARVRAPVYLYASL